MICTIFRSEFARRNGECGFQTRKLANPPFDAIPTGINPVHGEPTNVTTLEPAQRLADPARTQRDCNGKNHTPQGRRVWQCGALHQIRRGKGIIAAC